MITNKEERLEKIRLNNLRKEYRRNNPITIQHIVKNRIEQQVFILSNDLIELSIPEIKGNGWFQGLIMSSNRL